MTAEMNDGDFLMVPTPDEQEGNSDPLWIPENEDEDSGDEPMEVEIIENKAEISSEVVEKIVPPGINAKYSRNFQYPCFSCSQKRPTAEILLQHVTKTHPEHIKFPNSCNSPGYIETKNQCTICNLKCTTYKSFSSHIRNFHCYPKPLRYNCPRPNCNKSFTSPYKLKFHLELHDGMRRYKYKGRKPQKTKSTGKWKLACASCPEILRSCTKFLDHVTQTHPELIKPCDFTQIKYNPNLPFECTICKFRYPDDMGLMQHIKIRHEKALFVCPYEGCGQIFRYEGNFNSHLKAHNQGKFRIIVTRPGTLDCPTCHEIFTVSQLFMDHVVQTHPELVKPPDAGPVNTKPGSVKCLICNINYRGSIRQHLRAVHTNFNRYGCSSDDCGVVFSTKSELKKHMDAHAQGINLPLFTCRVENCGRTFTDKVRLSQHVGIKHPAPKNLICPSCSEDFNNATEFMKHFVKNHPELVKPPKEPCRRSEGKEELEFKCLICELTYKTSGMLLAHLRFAHLKIKPFKCPHEGCNRSFRYNNRMEAHLKTVHDKSVKFICELCGEEFSSLGSLNSHKTRTKKHNTELLFKCTQCPKDYTENYLLQKHIKDVHVNGGVSVKTTTTTKKRKRTTKTTKPLTVTRIIEAENDPRFKPNPTTCSICSDSFPCLFDFTAHFRANHTDEDPPAIYSCSHPGCEKKFKLWDKLRAHRFIHKPPNLKCPFPECTRAFTLRQNYKKHLGTHQPKNTETTERKYVCNKCPKAFLWPEGLKQHVRGVHEGLKRYVAARFPCTYPGCDKQLSSKTRLKLHLQTHEENREPTYSCTFPGCDKKFLTPYSVYQHIYYVHEKRKPWPGSRKKSKISHTSTNDGNSNGNPNPEYETEIVQQLQTEQEAGDPTTVDFSALIALE